jgi:hypothetical protein
LFPILGTGSKRVNFGERWHRWHEITKDQRLDALEAQMERYTGIGKVIRLEFKGFIPKEVTSSQAIRKLKAQGKLEIKVIQ